MLTRRTGHALAYDSVRQRVILFGGLVVNTLLGETWEWDGTSWSQMQPATSPPARRYHAMAFDAVRRVTVLFGGQAGTTYLGDTWEYDGVDWTQRNPTSIPPPRYGHTMFYDAATQRTVLVGGHGGTYRSDVWEWDGTAWTGSQPATGPTARYGHAMAYDAVRQKAVLFGGIGDFGESNDAWELAGGTWTPIVAGPPRRALHAMAFDAVRQRVVMFGGSIGSSGMLQDVWEWNGVAWTQSTPATNPNRRQEHAMVYDAARQRTVMFGGSDNVVGAVSDTWEWDGTSWQLRGGAPLGGGGSLAYDDARQRIVLFAGYGPLSSVAETWELDGATWTRRFPTVSPPGRSMHAMAYDTARRRVVLFGGQVKLADTWEWDGTTWLQLQPATSPPGRAMHAMVYDVARQRTVLFGGSANGVWLDDTWEWDGTNWTQKLPSAIPPGRYWHAMAYDWARQRTILFGGYNPPMGSQILLSDTWEWDGTNWRLLQPAARPTPRRQHAMTYDASRGRVVLNGGYVSPNVSYPGDTWEWDGTNWTQVTITSPKPPPRLSHALVYDMARQRTVMFGGATAPNVTPEPTDPWFYGDTIAAAAQTLGVGCGGAGGPPVLTGGLPFLGNPSLRLDLMAARAAASCVLGVAALPDNVALGGGCTLYLKDPVIPLAVTTSGAGFASWKLAVPADPALRSGYVHAQAVVLDPQGGPLGLAFSAHRALVLGD